MWQPPSGNRAVSSSLQRTARIGPLEKGKDRPCVSKLDENGHYSLSIKDHNGNDVKLVWNPEYYDGETREEIAPFPYQVYLTRDANIGFQDVDAYAKRLLSLTGMIGPSRGHKTPRYRFEIYTQPLTNVLACIAHQREEVAHRRRNRTWPSLVSDWATNLVYNWCRHRGRIIVLDREDWLDTGPLMVDFDPLPGGEYPDPYAHQEVHVTRIALRRIFQSCLYLLWRSAGRETTEQTLRRYNDGGFSPVLYPAMDPTAHYDAEHDESYELDAEDSSTSTPSYTADSPLSDGDGNISLFDKIEIFKAAQQLKHLRSESYSDSFGHPVTSVWNPVLSKTRPPFSITAYLSWDVLPFESEALFACLNKELLAQEAWTLDVVRNMPGLDAALDYHTGSSARRKPERFTASQSCIRMLLAKINNGKLPTELLDHIEGLLLQPVIPDYTDPPYKPYRNVFIYIDKDHMFTCPLLVYSNRLPFWPAEISASHSFANTYNTADRRNTIQNGWRLANTVLEVRNMRYWRYLVNEIHNLWSRCGPRCPFPPSDFGRPQVTVTLKLPQDLEWGQFRIAYARTVSWEFHFSEPIVVPIDTPVSRYMCSMFDVIDLENDAISLSFPPLRGMECNSCFNMWSQYPHNDHFSVQKERSALQTLTPGIVHSFSFDSINNHGQVSADEREYGMAERMVHGRQYALRLREDAALRRWTFGTAESPRGPYNLPPIPIVMSEDSQLTFRYSSRSELGTMPKQP